jgi:serine protease Do
VTGRGQIAGALLGLLVGVALGALILILRSDSTWFDRAADESPPVHAGEPARPVADADTSDPGAALTRQRSNAIVRATRLVAPAVVSISVVQQQATRSPGMELWERLGFFPRAEAYRHVRSIGSGVIVSPDGLIVTNLHVVSGAVQIIVTLSDGRRFQAQLRDAVERFDLAVLQIEGQDLPAATLATVEDLQIGEWAIAIGSPFGYLLADSQPTVTVGVISALNRDIRQGDGDRVYLGMIQTDAAINPGNSGGPLVNTAGEVVGINTFIFSESGGSVGIGFAVPAARVATVVEEIRRYGHYRRVSLGFEISKLTPAMMEGLNISGSVQGLLVWRVLQGSSVYNAGLRPGDVLRELGGQPMTDLDAAYRVIYDTSVGDRLSFAAERDGIPFTGEILVEELD